MPGGRPTKYRKEFCEMLVKHMAQGYSYESFSAVIKTDRSQLYRWEKSHKEFCDAKKRAREQCLIFWEKAGMAGTFGKIAGFSTGAWIFNMKNRFNWVDRQETEITGGQNEIKISYDPKARPDAKKKK